MSESTKKAAVAVTFHKFNQSGYLGAECAITEDPADMCLTWGDGTRTIVSKAALQPLHEVFMWHGAKQKLIDGAAIARNPETGRSATVADKREAVLAIIARIEAGEWNKAREGGSCGTLLLEALMRLYPEKTRAALSEYLGKLSPEDKRKLERNPRVAPVVEAIRTERRLAAGSDGDGEDILDAIGDLP